MPFPETHTNGEVWNGAAVTDLESRAAGYVDTLRVASAYLTPSGGDDSARMAAVLTSFAPFAYPVIALGPGTFLWNTTVPALLRSTPCKILGAGVDKTIVQLSSTAPRFLDFNKIADYDLFEQIEISDLTVDCNNTLGVNHVVIGTKHAGVDQYLLSFDHITIRRVRTINVPSCQTLANYSTSTNNRLNVALASWHHHTIGGDSQTKCTNILIEDCSFEGGNVGVVASGGGGGSLASQPTGLTGTPSVTGGSLYFGTYFYRVVTFDSNGSASPVSAEFRVVISSGLAGSVALSWTAPAGTTGTYQVWRSTEFGRQTVYYTVTGSTSFTDTGATPTGTGRLPVGVNCWIDNVIFSRCYWNPQGGVPTSYAPQEGFQIGSLGFGGRYELRDCHAVNSADNGIEIDGHSYALVENCTVEGVGAVAIDGYTLCAFSTPRDPQTTLYRGCKVIYDPAATVAGGCGWGVNGFDSVDALPGAGLGRVIFDDCTSIDQSNAWGVNGRLFAIRGNVPEVVVRGARHNAPWKTPTLTQNADEYIISWVGTSAAYNQKFVLRDVVMQIQGIMNLNGFAEGCAGVLVSGAGFTLDWDNLDFTYVVPGSSLHGCIGVYGPNATQGTAFNPSVMRRVKVAITGDSGPYGLNIGDSAHTTFHPPMVLEDWDLTNLSGGGADFSLATIAQQANIILVRPRVRATVSSTSMFRPAAAMSTANFVSATFTTNVANQYIGMSPALIEFANGSGAGITAISVSVDGTNFYGVYSQASGAMAQAFAVRVDSGSYVSVTFTGTQPATTVVYQEQ